MIYQVLARKWRPKNFSGMVGQDTTVQTLSNALTHSRLHHAYLFTGTRGVGKTTIARIIAKCFNCEQGVTATPCGICSICKSIDAGQFVDLIEVDAASRTKVEDTRDLLDNVQYAPSQGRYKIYLIDEVHMLSGHSFNALLKTLEEPPEHVKFLLATTDPQKLPITILSRCLQFHLRSINPEVMRPHLEHILTTENIAYELPALELIAEAAKGSLRDALSLLDQAIAYGNQQVLETTTRAMLGTLAPAELYPLLDALAKKDASQLLQHIQKLAEHGVDFAQVLTDFITILHKVSVIQIAPEAYAYDNDKALLAEYGKQFSAEDLQLFYQFALLGYRDMSYTPNSKLGFEMTLLRMLHFEKVAGIAKPVTAPTPSKPPVSPKILAHAEVSKATAPVMSAPVVTTTPIAPASSSISPKIDASWLEISRQLSLGGLTKVLAENSVMASNSEGKIDLQLDPKHASLLNDKLKAQLNEALNAYYQIPIKLTITTSQNAQDTPAKQQQRHQDERLAKAKETLTSDPHVQTILQQFGGTVDERSIKPIQS